MGYISAYQFKKNCLHDNTYTSFRGFGLVNLSLLIILEHLPTGKYSGSGYSVDVATRYGLDSPGIETRLRRDFPNPSRLALGLTQPPMQGVPALFRGQNGRGVA
jgi:hypothetical protein